MGNHSDEDGKLRGRRNREGGLIDTKLFPALPLEQRATLILEILEGGARGLTSAVIESNLNVSAGVIRLVYAANRASQRALSPDERASDGTPIKQQYRLRLARVYPVDPNTGRPLGYSPPSLDIADTPPYRGSKPMPYPTWGTLQRQRRASEESPGEGSPGTPVDEPDETAATDQARSAAALRERFAEETRRRAPEFAPAAPAPEAEAAAGAGFVADGNADLRSNSEILKEVEDNLKAKGFVAAFAPGHPMTYWFSNMLLAYEEGRDFRFELEGKGKRLTAVRLDFN